MHLMNFCDKMCEYEMDLLYTRYCYTGWYRSETFIILTIFYGMVQHTHIKIFSISEYRIDITLGDIHSQHFIEKCKALRDWMI